jgi:cephalosporin hydroxylase
MKIIPSQESLELVRTIAKSVKTFHHHYHILYDIAKLFPDEYKLNYVEIGCYAGASACLMLQRKNTNVYSIDIGHPISPDVVLENVNSFNQNRNLFYYLNGNSHNQSMLDLLKTHINTIDILFIDGGHSYNDVIADFTLYDSLMKLGGYILFDDYNDFQYSPEVHTAVDYLSTTSFQNYEVIGTIDNVLGAYPAELTQGNEFLIRKK